MIGSSSGLSVIAIDDGESSASTGKAHDKGRRKSMETHQDFDFAVARLRRGMKFVCDYQNSGDRRYVFLKDGSPGLQVRNDRDLTRTLALSGVGSHVQLVTM